MHPDHDTICKFGRENFEAVSSAFLEVLLLARERKLKLLKVGIVSVDGTKMDANASKRRCVRYDRAKALQEKRQADIAKLMEQAEAADNTPAPDDQSLPRREALEAKLDEARTPGCRSEGAGRTRAGAVRTQARRARVAPRRQGAEAEAEATE